MNFKFDNIVPARVLGTLSLALLLTACAGQPQVATPASKSAGESFRAEVVTQPTTVPVPSPTPAPSPTPVPTLPTEIVEPVSPLPLQTEIEEDESLNQNQAPGSRQAVDAAIADLLQTNGIAANQIAVTAVEARQWSDSSLGCPKEGFMYAQVITPGFLIVLAAQGQTFEYHTNQDGSSVVLCES